MKKIQNKAGNVYVNVEYKDHDTIVLTNEKGDTYTSKSEELMDFFHFTEENFPDPATDESTENLSKIKDKDQWMEEVRGNDSEDKADEIAANKILSEYEPRGYYDYSDAYAVPTYDQDTVREMLCNFSERMCIAFAEWISIEGFERYDRKDRWTNRHDNRFAHSTKELYTQYLQTLK